MSGTHVIIIFIHFVLDENEKGSAQNGADEQNGNDDDYCLWHDHDTFEGMEADLDGDHSLAPRNSLRRSAALYLLTLKEQYQLTQAAMDFSIGQVRNMFQYALEDIQKLVEERVTSNIDVSDCFSHVDPFETLETEYLQSKYYKENFGLVVSIIISYCQILYTMNL